MLHKLSESDYALIITSLALLCFGILMVYSSSALVVGERKADPFFFLKKQVLWCAISVVFFMFFLCMNYKYLQNISTGLIILTFLFLIAVFFFGKTAKGAKRWLDFGPISFQPSEFAKFSIVIFLADYIDKNKSKLTKLKGLLIPLGIIGAILSLILIEPDLGNPAIIAIVVMALLFVGGIQWRYLFALFLLAMPVLYFAFLSKPYRMVRLMAFLNPWDHAQSSAYQLCQSLMSLGSGGILGKGLGQSELKRFFLPAAHTDFIFSIIGEEMGLAGTIVIVALFMFFLYRGIKIGLNTKNLFGMLLATGITFTIVIQAFLNIAVCTGCLPTKGITLPFFSYGGSSLIITLSALGILANISQHRSEAEKPARLNFRRRGASYR